MPLVMKCTRKYWARWVGSCDLMGWSVRLFLYLLFRKRHKTTALPSPDLAHTPVVWIVTRNHATVHAFCNIAQRLEAAGVEIHLLFTGPDHLSEATVSYSNVTYSSMPGERTLDVLAFHKAWSPVLCLWDDGPILPGTVLGTKKADVPIVLINCNKDTVRSVRGIMGRSLIWRTFGALRLVFSTTHASGGTCIRYGVPEEQVVVSGALTEGIVTLECNTEELDEFSQSLSGRDIWLAAQVPAVEENLVLQVHDALRSTNRRLLLILNPRHTADGPALAASLKEKGWKVRQRSKGEPITDQAQVFIADTDDELGLWYRLAPVSYLGGSLTLDEQSADPRQPAALGSAIVHGPRTAPHRDVCDQLHVQAPPAAVQAVSAESLTKSISELLSPDRAAAQAHSAWEYVSRGAELTDQLIALITEAIELSENKDA